MAEYTKQITLLDSAGKVVDSWEVGAEQGEVDDRLAQREAEEQAAIEAEKEQADKEEKTAAASTVQSIADDPKTSDSERTLAQALLVLLED